MADWKNYYKKGLDQTEYRQDKTRLEKFDALESDWKKLFDWIMALARKKDFYDCTKQANNKLIDIWHNHVLTVLIEIIQKNPDDYKDTFVRSRGTMGQKAYMKNLRGKIVDWDSRLDRFLRTQWLDDRISSYDTSIQAAQSIRQHLSDALQGKITGKFQPGRSLNPANQPYYQMLQAIRDIKRQSNRYIQMIENSGTIDASLALLLIYIRNYCFIVDKFNRSLLSLPDYYHNEILKTTERKIVQDCTYVVINPRKEGFTLPQGTRFPAGNNARGEDLYYHTEAPCYLTGGKLAKLCTVYLHQADDKRKRLYTQDITLGASDTTILFDRENLSDVSCGWMLESHLFTLEEGKRTVTISFRLTTASGSYLQLSGLLNSRLPQAFDLHASCAEGWMSYLPEIFLDSGQDAAYLRFQFTVTEVEYPLSPCSEEIHGCSTVYPCIKILTNNRNCPYDWAHTLAFNQLGIDVEVEGIRHFNLYNELGEVDSTQPFYPFGTQAERGAWFRFCNEEISCKTVSEVSLKGAWNNLPQIPGSYTGLYKDYKQDPPLTNQSFLIKLEYQKNEKWYPCPENLIPLFQEEGDGIKEEAQIRIRMTDERGKPLAIPSFPSNTTYSRGTNLFFRITLHAPSIGFGMEGYRRLFADIMIYNSRHNDKEQKEVPSSPVVPLLADLELSYKASWKSDDEKSAPFRLVRITDFAEHEECLLNPGMPLDFLEDLGNERNLYVKFTDMQGDKRVRMYVDLSYIQKNMFLSDNPASDASPYMEFDYRKSGQWLAFSPESLLQESTYGLTQDGFIEFTLPRELHGVSSFWLRVRLKGDVDQYPAIRNIYLNCLKVVAENGDGTPLPAETIEKMQVNDDRVESVLQPLPGFGGRAKETIAEIAIRQSSRIAHRNRAVAPGDYEQMVLDQFPEIQKVYCLPKTCTGYKDVYLVVFSYTEGNPYPLTPTWKLAEIRDWLSPRISPFVSLKVCNPSYRKVDVVCEVVLQEDAEDEGEIRRRMTIQIQDYFALWLRTGDLPELGKKYSYKELHTRLANDPDVQELVRLSINGVQPHVQATDIHAEDQCIPEGGVPAEVVLIPQDIQIILLPHSGGIGNMEIGSNFKIG